MEKEKTLLEKAKEAKAHRRDRADISRTQMLELSISYAKREITGTQCAIAIGGKTNGANASARMSRYLMAAIRQGIIKIEVVE
jgi:hypothetical protein